jgi:tRNA 2-thiouridine synthesizing protein E
MSGFKGFTLLPFWQKQDIAHVGFIMTITLTVNTTDPIAESGVRNLNHHPTIVDMKDNDGLTIHFENEASRQAYIKENVMTQFTINALDSETASQHRYVGRAELNDQRWNRTKSSKLAKKEGMTLNDEQWDVIVYLRGCYLEQGLPRFARTTARDLSKHYSLQGGNKYLHRLFTGGPVSQGCRLANLRTPACASDSAYGFSY